MNTKSSVPLKDTISWDSLTQNPSLPQSLCLKCSIKPEARRCFFQNVVPLLAFISNMGCAGLIFVLLATFKSCNFFLIKQWASKTHTHHTTAWCLPKQVFFKSASLLPWVIFDTATSGLILNSWQCMHVTQSECYYCLRLASCHLVCLLLHSFDSRIRTNCESARCISSQKDKPKTAYVFPSLFQGCSH